MSRSRRPAPSAALALALTLAAGLAACGKMGELERPGPLFGGAPSHGPVQRTQAQDPNRPVQTVDPRDENATPAPPRTIPIPGQNPAPNAPAIPGALPDPYSNPPR